MASSRWCCYLSIGHLLTAIPEILSICYVLGIIVPSAFFLVQDRHQLDICNSKAAQSIWIWCAVDLATIPWASFFVSALLEKPVLHLLNYLGLIPSNSLVERGTEGSAEQHLALLFLNTIILFAVTTWGIVVLLSRPLCPEIRSLGLFFVGETLLSLDIIALFVMIAIEVLNVIAICNVSRSHSPDHRLRLQHGFGFVSHRRSVGKHGQSNSVVLTSSLISPKTESSNSNGKGNNNKKSAYVTQASKSNANGIMSSWLGGGSSSSTSDTIASNENNESISTQLQSLNTLRENTEMKDEDYDSPGVDLESSSQPPLSSQLKSQTVSLLPGIGNGNGNDGWGRIIRSCKSFSSSNLSFLSFTDANINDHNDHNDHNNDDSNSNSHSNNHTDVEGGQVLEEHVGEGGGVTVDKMESQAKEGMSEGLKGVVTGVNVETEGRGHR